ncbi:MAG: hypothetical protein AAFN63_11770 [Pseudomonadota bacterium]
MLRHNGNHGALAEEARQAAQLILDDISEHKPDVMILSAESFFSAGRQERFSNLIAQLNAWADKVIVVAYIRAPAPLYLSRVQQNLRLDGFEKPGTGRLNYRVSLEPYLNTEGITLNVHEYDRTALIGGDIVKDFTTRYLSVAATAAIKTLENEQNTSTSPEAMAIYEDVHAGRIVAKGQDSGTMTRKLSALIRSCDNALAGKSRPVFKPGIARIVHDAEPDMDWVSDTFGIQFKQPKSHPDASGTGVEDLTNVRAICDVDEERYQTLFRAITRSQKPFINVETGPLRILRPAISVVKAIRRNPFVKGFRSGFWKVMRPIRKRIATKKIRGLLRRSSH